MSNQNAALMRRWFEEVWNQGNLNVIDELASPNVVAQGEAEHTTQIGREQFRDFARALRAAFPDIHMTIHQTIAEGDIVALRWTATMTHKGDFQGMAATGRKATVNGITWVRMENGQIAEAWDNWDQLGLLVQLGSVPHNSFLPAQAIEAKKAS